MKNKQLVIVLIVVLSIGITSFSVTYLNKKKEDKVLQPTKRSQTKPNIIFILADDLGYGDVGFNGQEKIKTPYLDQMATEGMIFTNHYAGSTVCGPSRVSLMTGLHTGHSPVRGNPSWTRTGNPVDISDEQVTVAEQLKKAGYTTGIVGKWGLAENLGEGKANRQGFDYFYGFNKHRAAHHYYPDSIWENEKFLRLEGNIMKEKKGKYSHDLFTTQARDFINKNKDNPFFLYLAYTVPHYELTISEEEKEYYYQQDWPLRKMKPAHYLHDENGFVTYAAMVSKMDKDIGGILALLKDLDIDDNTLVIFTSDNGHEYDNVNDEFFNSNGIYRGKKRDLYEGGIRVPFIARWPGKVKAGSKTEHISAFWDFMPTACDIAGVEMTIETDGISYAPTLMGKPKKQKQHDYLYWEFNESKGPIQAVRMGKWKAVKYLEKDLELYNLEKDPGEQNDVALQNPQMAAQTKSLLSTARTEHPEFPLVKKKR